MYAQVFNDTRGTVLCESVQVADSFWTRFRGLMCKASLEPGNGMLIDGDGSIHSAFMRFNFDAVFMNSDRIVVKLCGDIAPWRVRAAKGAKSVLELPSGEIEHRGVQVGDQLCVKSCEVLIVD